MSAMDTVKRLVGLGPRWTGMEGADRAPGLLANALREAGREAEVEEIRVRPAYHVTHAVHMGLGAAGSVLSATASPPLGVVLLLVAGVSMYLDLTARFYLVRLLTPRRRAANVTSPGPRPDAPARVILTAHHDAGRTGLLYWRRSPRRATARKGSRRRLRPSALAGRVDVAFWVLIAALLAAVARLATGPDAPAMDVLQFVLTVALMAYATLFLDVLLSAVSPGANGNASGAAAVLEVARRLGEGPPRDLDVWIVLPAAKEAFMLGMRRWMADHAGDVDPRNTFFVNVDSVGSGRVHHVTGEGFALLYRHDQRLLDTCERLGSQPRVWRLGTDGVIPAMLGFPSVTVCCADERGRVPRVNLPDDSVANLDPDSIAAATDFVEDLVREIDAAVAESAPDGGAEEAA